jgi:hypothetical protein
MELELANEIIDCLPTNRTLFRYTKDQYAIYLLQRMIIKQGYKTVAQLKQSPCRQLLDKPFVKDLLQSSGKAQLEAWQFESCLMTELNHYALTLGTWGSHKTYSWNQTSRPGCNLVLQLNLPEHLDGEFKKLAGCVMNKITSDSHPQSSKRSATLAWARLDIDMNSGQVLIEEIQSDLIRKLDWVKGFAVRSRNGDADYFVWQQNRIHRQRMIDYCERILVLQKKIWAEAMMAATLWFIHCELGLNKVFYNNFETGNKMKGINYREPPRSLYTDLPEKFCFKLTQEAPSFITEDKKAQNRLRKIKNAQWYLLTI